MRFSQFGILICLGITVGVFGEQQIQIDKLTSAYIASEKAIWKKIDTQLILIDRGSLLNEIYHEHVQFLGNDFGGGSVLWHLGIQKYESLIGTLLSINTNAKNIQDYLTKAEYAKLADLAKNAAGQMLASANSLNATIGSISFWSDLATNV